MRARLLKNINNLDKPEFSMPFGLRLVKQCAENRIDYKNLHIADVMSILCSIDIDNIKQHIKHERQQNMSKRGISSISKATSRDFDSL